MKKININTARKKYNEGGVVIVKPCNMRLEKTMWTAPMELQKTGNEDKWTTFDTIINEYAVYNCNAEMGKRLQFYIKAV